MMIRPAIVACLAISALALPGAHAEPVLKVMNFTADWCPNCRILNPRLTEAVSAFSSDDVEIVNIDLTRMSADHSEQVRAATLTDAATLAETHKISSLWEQYGPVTGLAVIISADTGELIACAMRPMRADDIADQLKLAKILAEHARPGQRAPDRTNCPAP